MTSPNRPPSCDLPPEFYQTKLKECFACCSENIDNNIGPYYECSDCGAEAHKADWNSIPRRSEVMELIRLVDDVYEWRQHLKGDEFCELRADIRALGEYTNKLRKEIGG